MEIHKEKFQVGPSSLYKKQKNKNKETQGGSCKTNQAFPLYIIKKVNEMKDYHSIDVPLSPISSQGILMQFALVFSAVE